MKVWLLYFTVNTHKFVLSRPSECMDKVNQLTSHSGFGGFAPKNRVQSRSRAREKRRKGWSCSGLRPRESVTTGANAPAADEVIGPWWQDGMRVCFAGGRAEKSKTMGVTKGSGGVGDVPGGKSQNVSGKNSIYVLWEVKYWRFCSFLR